MPERTALFFGGTFDPPNAGHLQLISYILNDTKLADFLIVAPTRRSPFKSSERDEGRPAERPEGRERPKKEENCGERVKYAKRAKCAGPEDRLKMVRLAILNLPKEDQRRIEISDVELMRPEPSYTIDTLLHFIQENGQLKLGVLIGDDHLDTFPCWHSYLQILRLCPVYVFLRYYSLSQNAARLQELRKKWLAQLAKSAQLKLKKKEIEMFPGIYCLSNPVVPSSSSSLRQEMFERKGVDGPLASTNLSKDVREYILKRKLYW